MGGLVRKIDEGLREARLALAEVDGALDREDWGEAEAWCNELLARLRRMDRDIRDLKTAAIEAPDHRKMEQLRRTYPR